MEEVILQALSYNLCPPTATSFVGALCDACLPSSVPEQIRQSLWERSIFYAELSVMDERFIKVDPSCIAFSAVLNALQHSDGVGDGRESRDYQCRENRNCRASADTAVDWPTLSLEDRTSVIQAIEDCLEISHNSRMIRSTREKLCDIYFRSIQYTSLPVEDEERRDSMCASSTNIASADSRDDDSIFGTSSPATVLSMGDS